MIPLAYIEWTLAWSWGARLAALGLGLVPIVLAWHGARRLQSAAQRRTLVGLRAATVALVLTVLLQPTWVEESEEPGQRVVAVVVDRSSSMARRSGGESRYARAVAIAAQVAENHQVALFSLAESCLPVESLARLRAIAPAGFRTDLAAAIDYLGDVARPHGLAAVLVLSDGLDNGRLTRGGRPGEIDQDVLARVSALEVPVHSALIEDPVLARDVAVAAIHVSPFAFTRAWLPVTVEVQVQGEGEFKRALEVQLTEDGQTVASGQLPAGPGRRAEITLGFQPSVEGAHIVGARVLPMPGEATSANNEAFAPLAVVRDRVRVLHLAGHPSWDSRFLREHLRSRADVDLVSFYVMVDPGSGMYVAAEDSALIPFPTRELFEEGLAGFDLVVLQDFPLGPFALERHLGRLGQWLREGGGLLVLGGPRALTAGNYLGSPLAEWLPVGLLPLAPADEGFRTVSFAPQLVGPGLAHPVVRLRDDPAANRRAWAAARLSGRNTSLRQGDGQVLVTDERSRPLLAVADRGRGRVALIATDSLWTWAFPSAAGESERAQSRADYHRLLTQLTGWLLHDPEHDLLRADLEQSVLEPGDSLAARVRVRGPDLRPEAGARVTATLRRLLPDRARTQAPVFATAQGQADGSGEALLRFASPPSGLHVLRVEAQIQGTGQGREAPLAVLPATAEESGLRPSGAALAALARASGGETWIGAAPRKAMPMTRHHAAEWMSTQRTEFWSRFEVWLVLVVLLVCEWALRRRWGLA
jgi:uncharacterized membrane protein